MCQFCVARLPDLIRQQGGTLELINDAAEFKIATEALMIRRADYGRTSLMFFEPVNGDSNAGIFFGPHPCPKSELFDPQNLVVAQGAARHI